MENYATAKSLKNLQRFVSYFVPFCIEIGCEDIKMYRTHKLVILDMKNHNSMRPVLFVARNAQVDPYRTGKPYSNKHIILKRS